MIATSFQELRPVEIVTPQFNVVNMPDIDMAAWGTEQAWPLELDSSASAAPFPGEQRLEHMQHHQHQSHTSVADKRGDRIRAKEVGPCL
jgi:hypothetical protein